MPPQRIVCLTAETTEIAFAVGAGERVVGVTGYAVRPPEARKKPRIAAYQTADVGRIVALHPDLVLGFSDMQADIAAELIRAGVAVLVTNQRTLAETCDAIALIGAVLGEPGKGQSLADELRTSIEGVRPAPDAPRPRVYFEEWDEPLISGIAWVSELIEAAGGDDIFRELRACSQASDRVVRAEDVVVRDPELILVSWCGKKARLEHIAARPGWNGISAVREGRIFELDAPDILQPGPSLARGVKLMAAEFKAWREARA